MKCKIRDNDVDPDMICIRLLNGKTYKFFVKSFIATTRNVLNVNGDLHLCKSDIESVLIIDENDKHHCFNKLDIDYIVDGRYHIAMFYRKGRTYTLEVVGE